MLVATVIAATLVVRSQCSSSADIVLDLDRLETVATLAELARRNSEPFSGFEANLYKRASETFDKAVSLQQRGMTEQARKAYLDAMRAFRASNKTISAGSSSR